jgi:hypothetical protein
MNPLELLGAIALVVVFAAGIKWLYNNVIIKDLPTKHEHKEEDSDNE